MKIFKLMAIALVAMVGLNSCSKDCDHNFIEVDHSADLVGTWTCLEAGYAEALVIKADGTILSTGVEDGEYWENVAGNIVVKNGIATMTFEDGDNFEGHIDVIAGMAFSIYNEDGERMTYNYCANDLADEIVGMWVCNEGLSLEANGMAIQSYTENGKTYLTTAASPATGNAVTNTEAEYRVIGDLMIFNMSDKTFLPGVTQYYAVRLTYVPNANSLGDMMYMSAYSPTNDKYEKITNTWLRVKQYLNLNGKTYDYKSAYVTNVKGKDEDFSIMGNIFNIANINAGDFDSILGSTLFCVELNANSIKHKYILNGQDEVFDAPITVEGNKVTLDMSAVNPALRKVEMYMYQDADDSQLHMYMHTDAFINYFANLEVVTLIAMGEINQTDEAAIAKVFADMEARVESINVSFVMKARK